MSFSFWRKLLENYEELEDWHSTGSILEKCGLVVCPRPKKLENHSLGLLSHVVFWVVEYLHLN